MKGGRLLSAKKRHVPLDIVKDITNNPINLNM